MASQQESKSIPLKILVDKQRSKVVFVEATKDFVDTLFSFLSLPLGTIVRLLATINSKNDQQKQLPESSPFLENIKNLYRTIQNLDSNDVWNNTVCKQMLLHPRNPCEALCMKLFLNVDDTEPSSKFFVCDSCNTFTTFQNLHCTCGKPTNRQPKNLDSEGHGNSTSVDTINGVFVRENGSMFLVSDDLKIVPSSSVTYLQLLMELGYSDLTQLEEVTHNIGKQEILNLLKHTLTSHEPLTNTFFASSSKNKDNRPNQLASAVRAMPCTSDIRKIDVKVIQSKSQKNIIFAETNGDFVDFILSFLTVPLGSIVKLLGANSFAGCVGNLYKSVFGFQNQPLNIPVVLTPSIAYYYGTGTPKIGSVHGISHGIYYNTEELKIEGGVISKSERSIYNAKSLTALDPRSLNGSKVMGFVKRARLFGIDNDLRVKPLSTNSFLLYLKELSLPLDDLEVKVISIGEAEALGILGTFLTSRFTLTSGLKDLLSVPKPESTVLKVPKKESTLTSK
ncbi:DUF674 family protein [Medicago truncatula]|uniref:DUF674 family protein n=2 Tax=Medicago truncatula TaxID=3880 RepID=G7JQ74_MEDTR|nr:DUF674 family protein [Medicago truncatula]